MNIRAGVVWLFSCLLFAALVLSGCAPSMDYQKLGSQIASDKCGEATAYLEKQKEKYGSKQRLIYLMDAGMVNLYCGNYEKSNKYLQQADELTEELWTKSITSEGAAFLTNDYTIAYAGEDFEKALINAFSAINYTLMGNYDEALVECRRLNSRLELLNSKYEEKSVYNEDAFSRYLSGLIYESQNIRKLENLDSAFIDYDRAFDVFRDYQKDYGTPMPGNFIEDYLRVAQATGRLDEARRKVKDMATGSWTSNKEASGMGRVVLIHLNGRSPVKAEESIVAATEHGPIKIAFPRYEVSPPLCRESLMSLESSNGSFQSAGYLVEDINGIAVKNLEDRKGRVIIKAIARAVVKQTAIKAASDEMDNKAEKELMRVGLNLLNTAIERADTRTWRTLPGEIYIARSFVPPGEYSVSVKRCGKSHHVDTVTLEAGRTKFILLETVY